MSMFGNNAVTAKDLPIILDSLIGSQFLKTIRPPVTFSQLYENILKPNNVPLPAATDFIRSLEFTVARCIYEKWSVEKLRLYLDSSAMTDPLKDAFCTYWARAQEEILSMVFDNVKWRPTLKDIEWNVSTDTASSVGGAITGSNPIVNVLISLHTPGSPSSGVDMRSLSVSRNVLSDVLVSLSNVQKAASTF